MKALAPKACREVYENSLSLICVALVSLLAFTFFIATPIARARGAAMRVESFDLRSDGQVQIENARGATRIEVWDNQTVRVMAEKKSPPGSSLDPAELMLMSALNTVHIECKQTGRQGRIDLLVYVPRGARLQLIGGAFPIDVSGSLASAVIESTSGSIGYRLPASDDAQVVMRSASGVVRSTAPLVVSDRSGARSLQGRLGSGSAPIIINSQSGNITLTPGPSLPPMAKVLDEPRPSYTANGNYNNRAIDYQAGNQSRPVQDTKPRYNHDDPGDVDGDLFGNTPPQQRQRSSNPSSSGRDVAIFAGGSMNSEDTSEERSGPFYRPRKETRTSDGSSGLRVKIIPADTPLGAARSRDGSIYDSPDDQQSSRSQELDPFDSANSRSSKPDDPRATTNRQPSRPVYNSQADAQEPGKSSGSSSGDDGFPVETGTANRRSGAPPVLRRSSDAIEPGESEAPANVRSSDDDAIVLNSALVNLSVSVSNRSGVAFTDLKKEDFEVSENGERQAIEFFAPSTAPFNLVLVLDLSGSIKDKLKVVKEAALRFIEVVGPQDKVAVLAFTQKVSVISQLTANRDLLRKRIKEIDDPDGGTAFYEAMWFAMADTLRGTQGQRNAIVVMSDGVDSSLDRFDPLPTRVTFKQLANKLEESDVIVFPVYLDTEYEQVVERQINTSEEYAIARMQLERMAELTGGQMFQAQRVKDLSGVYKQVAMAIRIIYSVGYYPTNLERDGTFRRIRVNVNRPEAAVRTRKGYYAK